MSHANRIDRSPSLLGSVSEIVAAYVSNNHVATAELPALLVSVHAELMRVSELASTSHGLIVKKASAGEIRSSLDRDGIKSFLDGRIYKTLKRHLSRHGLTPTTYRERYGLPLDYPMIAPAYSERRTAISKAIGLGRSQIASKPLPGERSLKNPSKAAVSGRVHRNRSGRGMQSAGDAG